MTAQTTEPGGFNLVIHAPNRLLICALLDSVAEIEFGTVQERLKVSASVLSKHVTVLTESGYVTQRKAVRETRPRVWLRFTPEGRAAYREHVAALQAIVGTPAEPVDA
ncbi:transcriptional regulator [Micromonospora sp. NBC_01699]|uniref:transcriptional regulator n=1 Tax=Micromonospora sp. NBC_01699 TaxID=2975984 RepID=UPI002E2AC85B|nr:transcriptional regulator [Micromonospora sp. NBC_01699]